MFARGFLLGLLIVAPFWVAVGGYLFGFASASHSIPVAVYSVNC